MAVDPSVWTQDLPLVKTGDPVSAAVTNAAPQVLADRTAALRAMLEAIQAGEQTLLRDAPLAEGISAGEVVYFNTTGLVHEQAQAQWSTLVTEGARVEPADSAIYTGVVQDKSADRVGNILMSGVGALDSAALTALFGTSTPAPDYYFLSMLSPGTVTAAQPAMSVRTLQYLGEGMIRVFPPTHEPITHTHRSYRLQSDEWQVAASFDPSLVPSGATYGYNITGIDATDQGLGEALLPSVGEGTFVWLYNQDESSAGSAAPCDLGGLHVNENSVSLDEDGIWWTEPAPPECDIELQVTSADTHGLSMLVSIASLTPNAIVIRENSGRVTVQYLDPSKLATENTAGHLVVKDIVDHVAQRGPVVSGIKTGAGLTVSSPEGVDGDGFSVGKATVENSLFNNWPLPAQLMNLNNAATVINSPFVITAFPSNRTSQVTCKVTLPNLSSAAYQARIFALFLTPGSAQAGPDINDIVLVPTPTAAGVTPSVAAVSTFPAFPVSVTSGNVYQLISDDAFLLDGYSHGEFFFTLEAASPSPALSMIATGIILSLVP